MDIKTMTLGSLEANLRETLNECADSGRPLVVELPDHRLVAIQTLEPEEGDSLVDDLIRSNPDFRALIAKSKAGPRKPFAVGTKS